MATCQFIPDIKYIIENSPFDFHLSLRFLLRDHGALNVFLFQGKLSLAELCKCGVYPEDWERMLVLYEVIRDLEAFVRVVQPKLGNFCALVTGSQNRSNTLVMLLVETAKNIVFLVTSTGH